LCIPVSHHPPVCVVYAFLVFPIRVTFPAHPRPAHCVVSYVTFRTPQVLFNEVVLFHTWKLSALNFRPSKLLRFFTVPPSKYRHGTSCYLATASVHIFTNSQLSDPSGHSSHMVRVTDRVVK
jgi:hypothetical protein